jgi:hypothetical protein
VCVPSPRRSGQPGQSVVRRRANGNGRGGCGRPGPPASISARPVVKPSHQAHQSRGRGARPCRRPCAAYLTDGTGHRTCHLLG